MNSDGKTSLLINLIISFLSIVALTLDLAKIDVISEFFFDFGISSLVLYGKLPWKDVIILGIVDVEIFLPLVWEDGVQLKEILPARRRRTKPLKCQVDKSHHIIIYGYILPE